ncbi:MAG: hypothetical protein HYX28_05960 [Candidatus Koribacter versatilis]|uniref:Peptidase S41 n=1 Tax=Candidatus Korobacter versatilis TaxID=658062 RepID=A0A932A7U0_9BACT|nr:hypothetical protein [Candidatus Koribacter versatilis]
MRARILTLVLLGISVLSQGQAKPSSAWKQDLDYVVRQLVETHPNLYRRISKKDFDASVEKLRRDLPSLSDDEIAVRLMQLVASVRDEHTSLYPAAGSAEGKWFPVRFYRFTDGLVITAVDKRFPELAGARVVRVGDLSAEEACERAQSVFSSDNPSGALDAPFVLASPRVVRGLHISSRSDALTLRVTTRSGEERTVEIPAVAGKGGFDFYQYGEMFGPVDDLVTAFGGRVPDAFLLDPDKNTDLPLHLRGRRAFWFTYEPQKALLYFQLNSVREKSKYSRETLTQTMQRMLTFADLHPVELFVLDLRYNSGGNGALNEGIMREFIKRDSTFNRPGHLFVLVGRKTYSAAADLAMRMLRHTNSAFVGEPIGASPNGSGDPDSSTLPFSGMHLAISTNYVIGGRSKDMSWEVPVEFPAQSSSAQYFAGTDPAMDVVLDPAQHADVIDVLLRDGGAKARALYDERKRRFGTLLWWQPFERNNMNHEGYHLLEQGRKDDAVVAFEMNADRYPGSWEQWDSLAEGLMGAGRNREAIAAYRKALAISPNNFNAGFAKKSIEKMEAELAKAR